MNNNSEKLEILNLFNILSSHSEFMLFSHVYVLQGGYLQVME